MMREPMRRKIAPGRLARVLKRFAREEQGATVIEYGLIVSLIFLAIVAAVKGYVNSTSEMYSEIEDNLT